jgi:hypothetical protein
MLLDCRLFGVAELLTASELQLRAPSIAKARAWELAIRQSC